MEALIKKLEDARFTGKLVLRFEAGQVESARLIHYIPKAEFLKDPPIIEAPGCQQEHCENCRHNGGG